MYNWFVRQLIYLGKVVRMVLPVTVQLLFIGALVVYTAYYHNLFFVDSSFWVLILCFALMSVNLLRYSVKRLKAEGYSISRSVILSSSEIYGVLSLVVVFDLFFVFAPVIALAVMNSVEYLVGVIVIYFYAKLLIYYVVREGMRTSAKLSVFKLLSKVDNTEKRI